MAFVVARRGGRFEIRESLHTANGPRSRTLAGFDVLTEEVLAAAARRAQRPFDREAVIGSGRRAGARVRIATSGARRAQDRFLAGSKRMASALGKPPADIDIGHADAGVALMKLLSFVDMVRAAQPPRPFEPLVFPALSHFAERRVPAAVVAQQS
jgi:hypothetical protein